MPWRPPCSAKSPKESMAEIPLLRGFISVGTEIKFQYYGKKKGKGESIKGKV